MNAIVRNFVTIFSNHNIFEKINMEITNHYIWCPKHNKTIVIISLHNTPFTPISQRRSLPIFRAPISAQQSTHPSWDSYPTQRCPHPNWPSIQSPTGQQTTTEEPPTTPCLYHSSFSSPSLYPFPLSFSPLPAIDLTFLTSFFLCLTRPWPTDTSAFSFFLRCLLSSVFSSTTGLNLYIDHFFLGRLFICFFFLSFFSLYGSSGYSRWTRKADFFLSFGEFLRVVKTSRKLRSLLGGMERVGSDRLMLAVGVVRYILSSVFGLRVGLRRFTETEKELFCVWE